jgi:hypothetical protein
VKAVTCDVCDTVIERADHGDEPSPYGTLEMVSEDARDRVSRDLCHDCYVTIKNRLQAMVRDARDRLFAAERDRHQDGIDEGQR